MKTITQASQVKGVCFAYNWPDCPDIDRVARKLVASDVNAVGLDVYGAREYAGQLQPPRQGYWFDHAAEAERMATKFINGMRRRGLLVLPRLAAACFRYGYPDPDNNGEPKTFCSREFDAAWFRDRLRWVRSLGPDLLAVTPIIESGMHSHECAERQAQFLQMAKKTLNGFRLVYNGPAPSPDYPDWWFEAHPSGPDCPVPPGSLVVSDSYWSDRLYVTGDKDNPATGQRWYYSGAKAHLPNMRADMRHFFSQGNGCAVWLQSFKWLPDWQWAVCRMMGKLKRK